MYDTQLFDRIDFGEGAAPATEFRTMTALQSEVLVSLLDEIDHGLMVLESDARILLANQRARMELAEERLLRRRQDRLAAVSARDELKIAVALENIRHGRRSLVTLTGTDGELTLSFVPLRSNLHSPARAPVATLALVTLGKRIIGESAALRNYAHAYRLTGSEQALLPAIVRGLSVKAIANQRNVSVNTVRAHLGSIRAKTGARTLRVLMARLAGPACA